MVKRRTVPRRSNLHRQVTHAAHLHGEVRDLTLAAAVHTALLNGATAFGDIQTRQRRERHVICVDGEVAEDALPVLTASTCCTAYLATACPCALFDAGVEVAVGALATFLTSGTRPLIFRAHHRA